MLFGPATLFTPNYPVILEHLGALSLPILNREIHISSLVPFLPPLISDGVVRKGS